MCLAACSAGSTAGKSTGASNGSGGAANTVTTGSPATSGPGSGSGGLLLTSGAGGTTSSNTTDGAGGIMMCAGQVTTAQVVPLDMYVMLDISGSMLAATAGGPSKWDAVKSAFGSFFADPGSQGLGVGIQYFPLPNPAVPAACTTDADCGPGGPCFLNYCPSAPNPLPCTTNADCGNKACVTVSNCANDSDVLCTAAPPGKPPSSCGGTLGNCVAVAPGANKCFNPSICDPTIYGTPAVPIAPLSATTAATLTASLAAQAPKGATPTAPALTGALGQAYDWATKNPSHTVVAVLATDGTPTTECRVPPAAVTTTEAVTEVVGIATKGVATTPSIRTFVIGVFGPDDITAGAPANLTAIAQAGGTNTAFIVDTTQDVTQQFLAALNAIRSTGLACEFQIPTPTGTDALDYKKVNVDFTDGGTTTRLSKVTDATACANGGWYYDVNPSGATTPTKIIACPSNCDTFQKTVGGSVSIVLGCQTKIF